MTPAEVLEAYLQNKEFEIFINNQWQPIKINSLTMCEVTDTCQRNGLRLKRILYKKTLVGTGQQFSMHALKSLFEIELDRKYQIQIKEIV